MKTCPFCQGVRFVTAGGDPAKAGQGFVCPDCGGEGELINPDDDLVDALKHIASSVGDEYDRARDDASEADRMADQIDRDYERARDAGTLPE